MFITAADISAQWISLTYSCEMNVLCAVSDEIVAEEINAVSTVTAVIS